MVPSARITPPARGVFLWPFAKDSSIALPLRPWLQASPSGHQPTPGQA
ncbi:hypothetical protein [Synechococcus sp. WH 8016]|nr:hypothetical protein [Synechococcus sp. WH 8016]